MRKKNKLSSNQLQYVIVHLSNFDDAKLEKIIKCRNTEHSISLFFRNKYYSKQTTVLDVQLKVNKSCKMILDIRKEIRGENE